MKSIVSALTEGRMKTNIKQNDSSKNTYVTLAPPPPPSIPSPISSKSNTGDLYNYIKDKFEHYLDHMSLANVSKSFTDLKVMIEISDKAQSELYYKIVQDDIRDIVRAGGNLEEVMDYVNNLL